MATNKKRTTVNTARVEDILGDMIFETFDLNELIEMMKYVGFDVKAIKGVVNEYIKSGDEEQCKNDISILISLGMKRGNKVSKIVKSSGKQNAEWLQKMIEKLDIKDTIKDSDGNHSNNALTLSRLKKAFPQLAYDILKQPNFKRRVTVEMIKYKIPSFDIMPSISRDMCIMSLLPKKPTKKFGMDFMRIMVDHIFIYCICESSLLVNRKDKKKDEKDCAEEVIKYMKILFNAEHTKDNERSQQGKQIKEFLNAFKGDQMKMLKSQCDSIENYASKFDINILKRLELS